MPEHVEKEVKDFLRTADVLIARLQTAKPLSKQEMLYLNTYLARIKALLLSLQGFEKIEQGREILEAKLADK